MYSPSFPIPPCKHFTGYKPCFSGTKCLETCARPDPIGAKILLINLDAMGNVLVTTSILKPIKRKYPESRITWLTMKNVASLLRENSLVDSVFTWEPENLLILQQQAFDLVLNIDKSLRSCAFALSVRAPEKLGFGLNENGVIVPLNAEAEENYRLGLDDDLKFRVNQKTVGQIQCEQFRLQYQRDEYELLLTEEEQEFCRAYKHANGLSDPGLVVVGFNTGCSELYPNKKMTVEQHVQLVNRLADHPRLRLVLVGGPEDTERNAEIVRRVGAKVLSTPTTEGLRRGLCYVNICDVVVSGDSFGMHASIALKKHVVAWFGVTTAVEVDLYDRGVKLTPKGLECSPCWKRSCPYNRECIAMIDLDAIEGYIRDFAAHNAQAVR